MNERRVKLDMSRALTLKQIKAKQLLSEYDSAIPLIPGYNGDDQSVDRLVKEAIAIGNE